MIGLKRASAFVVAVVGLTLAAGSASALSSVNIVWGTPGGPGNAGNGTVDGDSISPTASNTVTAMIVLAGDSVGIGGVFVTILFDSAELDFVSALEHGGKAAKAGMGNQFAPVVGGVDGSVAGTISGFDSSAGLATGCISCTITLGSVVFHVTAPADSDGPNDVRLTVASGGIDGILSAYGGSGGGALTTASFGNAEIVGAAVPEPTTALLVVGGLLGLGYAGRRSVR